MIDPLQSPAAAVAATPPRPAPPEGARPPARSFAAAFAQASASQAAAGAPAAAPAAGEPRRPPPPAGETWRPVRGTRDHAEIVGGPRRGLFVNLTDNARRGMTFSIVEREGRTYHVYGSGADRREIEVGRDRARRPRARSGPLPALETWEPVGSRSNSARVLSGPRRGQYVNLSGNERDGLAFRLVQRDGHTLHVYGRGADRQVIDVTAGRRRDDGPRPTAAGGSGGVAAPPASGSGGAATGTGGASAPPERRG